MKCPVCKKDALLPATLDSGVPAFQCSQCSGIWISSNQYLAWLRMQTTPLPEKPAVDSHVPTWDTKELKLCPDCGHLLARYKVLPNLDFRLDRCGHCNGVWFDKDEWGELVERNLQDKVNTFFTQPWQTKLREEESRLVLEKLYRDKFGQEDYQQIQEVWSWLKGHPQRAMLLAYLQADNPYKI